MMKDELCAAFCEGLEIAEVPAGLAVGTSFMGQTGDRIAFYITGPDENGLWRIQDDGSTIPFVEATGTDLSISARAHAFSAMLAEYDANFDEETGELQSAWLPRDDVAKAAMGFVALLLRVQELAILSIDRVRLTWIEEAMLMLQEAIGERATIQQDAPVFPDMGEYRADLVIAPNDRPPVALFFGTADSKVFEALLIQTVARYQLHSQCEVVLLLENDGSVTKKARQRADNHLIVPRFAGAKSDAIGRIVEAALGERPMPVRIH